MSTNTHTQYTDFDFPKHSDINTNNNNNRIIFSFCSNSNVPHDVLQSLKKQCNPTLKKTFKERNPDVDMDEIQNNPNVPEDVKAAISGALSLALDDDEPEEAGADVVGIVETLEEFDDDYIMDISDDDMHKKKNRRRRIDENDEDWRASYKKTSRPKRGKKKKKKNKEKKERRNISENGDPSEEVIVKKKRSRKSNELNTSGTLNSTNTTINSNSSTVSNGSENLSNSEALANMKLEPMDPEAMRKENKQKKTPKKRDKSEKSIGIVKKTQSRRQFTSIKAIMECIESVVRGNDVSIDEINSSKTIVKFKIESPPSMVQPPSDMYSPKKDSKIESIYEKTPSPPFMQLKPIQPENCKPKQRRKSKTKERKSKTKAKMRTEETLQMGIVNNSALDSVSMNSLIADTTVKNHRQPHRMSEY